jgi:translation initiation factor 5B
VLCGWDGPIVTKIRALLTPPPLAELRVKVLSLSHSHSCLFLILTPLYVCKQSEYVPHKTVKAAMGVKISAPNLDGCVPGSSLLVCGPRDDLEELKDEVQEEIQSVLARIDRSGKVYIFHCHHTPVL